jgi:hypothetical protein
VEKPQVVAGCGDLVDVLEDEPDEPDELDESLEDVVEVDVVVEEESLDDEDVLSAAGFRLSLR